MNETVNDLARQRMVPIVSVVDRKDATPLGAALKAGGLTCPEITLRTPAALGAIFDIASDDELCVGAGTVLKPCQVDQALEAGARYIVTPGFNGAVVSLCQRRGVPVFPGIATATEIQLALDAGINVVKFFPAETIGGIRALAALAAPFTTIRFIPTGGISATTAAAYLAHPSVFAVGGSWITPADALHTNDFARISALATSAVRLVAQWR